MVESLKWQFYWEMPTHHKTLEHIFFRQNKHVDRSDILIYFGHQKWGTLQDLINNYWIKACIWRLTHVFKILKIWQDFVASATPYFFLAPPNPMLDHCFHHVNCHFENKPNHMSEWELGIELETDPSAMKWAGNATWCLANTSWAFDQIG